jgi:HK97 family phage major capsid protein
MIDSAVKIISQTDEVALVGGYGVIFGGVDLEGETFSADTNYMLDLVPTKLAMYDHGQQKAVDVPIGTIPNENIEADEKGLFVKAELDRSREYVDQVLDLVKKGILGWSSGTVGHLARRDEGKITQWPIIEFSLTPTPAEPRTLGVERIKSLAAVYPDLEALLPKTEQDTVTKSATDQGEQATDIVLDSSIKEDANMSDEKKEQNVTRDIEALTGQVKSMSESVAKVMEWVDKQPAINDGGTVQVVQDEGDRKFKTLGEQLMAVKNAAMPGATIDPRLLGLNARATDEETKTTIVRLNETIGAQGGFLVQEDFAGQILGHAYELGKLASRVRKIPVGANSNGLTAWAVNETARATGSRWGGVTTYWLGEAADKTRSKPTFREVSLRLRKLAGICRATDEVLQDAAALEAIVRQGFSEDIAWMVDDAIYNGLGGFQPLGVMASGVLVSVAKEVGQAADTIVVENILKMYSRRLGAAGNYSWFINQDIEPQLYGLALSVGTGGMPVYMPPGGLADAPYGRLMGLPVIPLEHTATVGTTGDIMLGNFSQYIMIDKGPIQQASSIHLYFESDETAFRFVYRCDGQPVDAAPVTPANSALTQSPFVVLDSRD